MADSSLAPMGRFRSDLLPRLVRVAFIAWAAVLTIRWIPPALTNYLPKQWSQAHEYDGLEDWLAIRYYAQGKNPYSDESLAELNRPVLGHPPTTGFWLIPLANVEKAVAAEVMTLTSLLLLFLLIYLCARAVAFPSPLMLATLGFAWWLTTDAMTMHWHNIQVSVHIAFALALCWVFLRRGQDVAAGVSLGFAAMIKLFPGLLILLMLFARRYRAFVAASATYLFAAGVMTATYGIESWRQFLRHQSQLTGWMGSVRNASLHGIILRFTSPVCVGVVSSRKATLIANGIALVLLALAVLVCRPALRHARERDPRSIDLPFALFTVLSAFLNPWIWEHYVVLFVQPAFVLMARVYPPMRDAWWGWLDEQTPGRKLVGNTLGFLAVAACLSGVGYVLKMSIYSKMVLEDLWRAHPTPWRHRYLHLMETLNWLPWAVVLLVCFVAAWRLAPRERRDSPAAGPAGEGTPS